MKLIETSRRKFLQGSVALCVYGTTLFSKTTKKNHKQTISHIPFICDLCRSRCGGIAKVKNDTLINITPNPNSFHSRGSLCAKGYLGADILYDEDRLKYPLIRIGQRGDGRYKRVTWDEACEYIKDKLVEILDKQKDNRSSVAYCSCDDIGKDEFEGFFKGKIGSVNFLDNSSFFTGAKEMAQILSIGKKVEIDIQKSDYVIMCGMDAFALMDAPYSFDLIKRKQKLVVIDSRASISALKADKFLPINPKSDMAIVLSMMYIGLKLKLYDKKYVREYFDDFELFRDFIINGSYTAKWAQEQTSIPESEIQRLSFDFFHSKNGVFCIGDRNGDFWLHKAVVLLNALKGNISKNGVISFKKSIDFNPNQTNNPIYDNTRERFDNKEIIYPLKNGSWLNFRDMVVKKTSPYPIKAMFIRKQNIMQNLFDIQKTKKMLEMMELVVAIDVIPNDTTLMADVILPECTYLEQERIVKIDGANPALALSQKVSKELYESKSISDILNLLGKKLSVPLFEVSRKHDKELRATVKDLGHKLNAFMDGGYDMCELYYDDEKQRNKKTIIKHFGKDVYKKLKQNGVIQIKADEKDNQYKLHVKCYDEKLKQILPDYKTKEDKKGFCLISGKATLLTKSLKLNQKIKSEFKQANVIWLNNKEAKKLGIKNMDKVKIIYNDKEIFLDAYVTNKIHPEALYVVGGGIQKDKSLNMIVDSSFEKICGCMDASDLYVDIKRVDI